ncbi:MAG: NADH-quinone oxidoreductase subunit C [Bacteroidia bacterium]
MASITNEQIVARTKEQFGDDLEQAYESYNMLTLVVNRERIYEAMKFLKEDKELNFHFLTDLCGIHYPDNKDKEIGVIYHLHNMIKNVRVRVKTFFPTEDSRTPSVTDLWASANWMERETYDFYGIIFEGHPDLRRILNVDDMDYFPMLKQYPLEDATREDKNDKMFGR